MGSGWEWVLRVWVWSLVLTDVQMFFIFSSSRWVKSRAWVWRDFWGLCLCWGYEKEEGFDLGFRDVEKGKTTVLGNRQREGDEREVIKRLLDHAD